MIHGWDISREIAPWWLSLDLTDDKSTLVEVLAWCRQATSHYLDQCWPRSMSPYGITRPQSVNYWTYKSSYHCWSWHISVSWMCIWFYGAKGYIIYELQLCQNNATRMLSFQHKFHHITPVLKDLHWLPVEQRIEFKVLLLTYKAFHDKVPVYLPHLLSILYSKQAPAIRDQTSPQSSKMLFGRVWQMFCVCYSIALKPFPYTC